MHAQDVGCNGVMILPVSYWPLTLDEVFDHYTRVAKSISIPVCLYNNPWTTGLDMKPDFLARLAQRDKVSCVNESTGDLTRISSIRQLTKGKLTIIAGCESSSLQAFAAGATAWAPVVTNFMPGEAKAFFKAAVFDSDFKKAQALWEQLYPICEYICAKTHIRVAHSGLEVLRRPVGPPRRPLRPLNAADRERLKDLLAEAMQSGSQPPKVAATR
jgi:4-hydroxy-tetrahydrodipicolinate synthase